jgi:hypothetical protein
MLSASVMSAFEQPIGRRKRAPRKISSVRAKRWVKSAAQRRRRLLASS